MPKVVFDHRNRSRRTLQNREYLAGQAAELLRAAGAKEIYGDWPVATRTAEKIFQRYFDGDPWVTREALVPSIDDRVTAAVLGQSPSQMGHREVLRMFAPR